uniref:Uncharacterized protein n=1 Tax=Trichobilharzia regenti TaxID=157069 RepID=A0AA85J2W9_TRIRE|nr:unnamed protein product [Trichobilharzia regenti]
MGGYRDNSSSDEDKRRRRGYCYNTNQIYGFIIMVPEDIVGVRTRTIRITKEDIHGTETKEGMAQIIDITQVIVIQVLMKGNEAEDFTKGHLLPTTITGCSTMNDNPKGH